MPSVAKIAISIPQGTLRSLERVRKRLRRSRSAIVTIAIEHWLRENELGSDDERYVRGYLRQPERVDASSAVAASVAYEWEPWE